MYLRTIVILVIALIGNSLASAQTFRQVLSAADDALAQEDPQTALNLLNSVYASDSSDFDLQFLYARAYYQARTYQDALRWATKAQSKATKSEPELLIMLGNSHMRLGQYSEAKRYFLQLRHEKNEKLRNLGAIGAASCAFAQDSVLNHENQQISGMGPNINTAYSEFAPAIRPDTFYYASLRYDNLKDTHIPARPLTKILTARDRKKGTALGKIINPEEDIHVANMAFSNDATRMYTTHCTYQKGLKIRCEIVEHVQKNNGKWQTATPVKVLNNALSTQTQPQIGYDSLEQVERMYFASDRPGGKGGLDIWTATYKNGEWSQPENLADINTSGNEWTPHFHNEQQTLYFSTDGRPGLGGADIFASKLTRDGYLPPQHLGTPINSSYEDLYFVIESCGCNAIIASNRPGSMYLDESNKTCCFDLYQIAITDHEPPADFNKPPPSLVTTTPKNGDQRRDTLDVGVPRFPIHVFETTPTTAPSKVEDFAGLLLYFDNDYPDPKTKKKSTNFTYGDTYNRYYAQKADYLAQFTADEATKDSIESFFENELKYNFDLLTRFEIALAESLTKGDSIHIYLKGFTSPRAQSNYNDFLAMRRISSVQNHFASLNAGLFSAAIKSGQLKITEVPLGESQAAKNVSDAIEDKINSVYAPAAARERRVEILQVKVNEGNGLKLR